MQSKKVLGKHGVCHPDAYRRLHIFDSRCLMHAVAVDACPDLLTERDVEVFLVVGCITVSDITIISCLNQFTGLHWRFMRPISYYRGLLQPGHPLENGNSLAFASLRLCKITKVGS